MTRKILIILQVAGGVYFLIVGAAILVLLVASIKTWLQIALNAVRRCAREIQTTRRTQ
jgi:membrane protein implicated in regulation of membrane protease activity